MKLPAYQILKDETGWYIATYDIYSWDLCRHPHHATREEAHKEMERWEEEDREAAMLLREKS